jgi:hypothetical protein
MPNPCIVDRIISGGQTGVDRSALDVAIFLEIPHGGWCPRNRLAEDGEIPDHYQLQETAATDYSVRTEQNVLEGDGTLVLFYQDLNGGTLLTVKYCKRHRRPVMIVDLSDDWDDEENSKILEQVRMWLGNESIRCLNVAGPRESNVPGINRIAERFLLKVLQPLLG